VGYLDELQAKGLVSSAICRQIREAYVAFLADLKRKQMSGDRLVLADLIALQFLLERSARANNSDAKNLPPLARSFSLRSQPDGPPGDHGFCSHCASKPECTQSYCRYQEILASIAARLDAAA
jgi:hypothetical protein